MIKTVCKLENLHWSLITPNRIKVIHKQNGGLSDARNVGIGLSNGKYISSGT